jgi:hypothetical protein
MQVWWLNYNYNATSDYPLFNDKIKQHTYGAGVFTRIFPVRFLFVQGQIEQNFINIRYNPCWWWIERKV